LFGYLQFFSKNFFRIAYDKTPSLFEGVFYASLKIKIPISYYAGVSLTLRENESKERRI